jgi:hypothetical protein
VDPTDLRHRFVVVLEDNRKMVETDEAIKAVPGVAKTRAAYEMAEGFSTLQDVLHIVSLAVISVLLIVSLLIISNTVKLAMYDRKNEIAIMKMVGATNGFIRLPFVVEGFTLGMVGAALAFGGEAEVQNLFGFMPLVPYEAFDDLHIANAGLIAPGMPFTRGIYRPSSTDMGDVSMIKPSLHAYIRGFEGTAHTDTFLVKDPQAAYVESVKFLVCNAIDLHCGGAEKARAIAALPTPMTKSQYLEAMGKFSSSIKFSY